MTLPINLTAAHLALLPDLLAVFGEVVDAWDRVCNCGQAGCRHERTRDLLQRWRAAG